MNESAKKYCENCLSKQIIIHAETINQELLEEDKKFQ